ncbi:MAG: hypothetical protein LLF86_05260 [Nitrospiraceae bacterium]|nr:hypothetical protein [Nitrospiraceae bacterium]
MPGNFERFHGRDLVFCDSSAARTAHKRLFDFNKDSYFVLDDTSLVIDNLSEILASCNTPSPSCPAKLHIVMAWSNMLRLATWKTEKPAVSGMVLTFKKAGIGSEELQPFLSGDIDEILPWLYYSKKHDALRKICHIAKDMIETRLDDFSMRAYCHLYYESEDRIAASSL